MEADAIREPDGASSAAPDLTEAVASDGPAPVVREDEGIGSGREPFEVERQCLGDDRRQWDRPPAGRRLRGRKVRVTATQRYELLFDQQAPAEEVDVRHGESERLALPEAGARSKGDERPVPVGHRLGERVHDGRLKGNYLRRFDLWQFHAGTRLAVPIAGATH